MKRDTHSFFVVDHCQWMVDGNLHTDAFPLCMRSAPPTFPSSKVTSCLFVTNSGLFCFKPQGRLRSHPPACGLKENFGKLTRRLFCLPDTPNHSSRTNQKCRYNRMHLSLSLRVRLSGVTHCSRSKVSTL